MVKTVEPISKVRPVKLRVHKHLKLRGVYYRKLISRIYSEPKRKVKQNKAETNTVISDPLMKEGNLLDKYC